MVYKIHYFGSMTVMIIRSRKSFFRSKTERYLLVATMLIVALTLCPPLTPFAEFLEFKPLLIKVILIIVTIIGL
jgi:P-type Mg2+ transporter